MKWKSLIYLLTSLFSMTTCSQNINPKEKPDQHIGGNCEGCEAIYESPVPFEKLHWVDTLPDYFETGTKMMVSGIIYQPDGKTPANDIVLYIYHTGQDGKYVNKNNEPGWAKRHGYIRGWMKTNEKGAYRFYTLVPASYPNSTAEKHIHPTIKEPGKNEYYIADYLFDDDPLLTAEKRNRLQKQRGGDGIIKLKKHNDILVAERNIYLGKHIPGYPVTKTKGVKNIKTEGSNNSMINESHFITSSVIPHWQAFSP